MCVLRSQFQASPQRWVWTGLGFGLIAAVTWAASASPSVFCAQLCDVAGQTLEPMLTRYWDHPEREASPVQILPSVLGCLHRKSAAHVPANCCARPPGLSLDLAILTSFAAYHPHGFQDLLLLSRYDQDGFAFSIFYRPMVKEVILAFRGTRSSQDWGFDYQLFLDNRVTRNFFSGLLDAAASISASIAVHLSRPFFVLSHARRHPWQRQQDLDQRRRNVHAWVLATLRERLGLVKQEAMGAAGRLEIVRNLVDEISRLFPPSEGYTVYATGHSLGGLFAQIAAILGGWSGMSLKAPGFPDGVIDWISESLPANHLYHGKLREVLRSGTVTLPQQQFVNYVHPGDLIHLYRLEHHYGPLIPLTDDLSAVGYQAHSIGGNVAAAFERLQGQNQAERTAAGGEHR